MKALKLAALLAVVVPSAFAQSWDYVSVNGSGQKPGEWETGRGKASVTWKGREFHVEVTYEGCENFGPAMHIDGRVATDGKVSAIATYLATDQTPNRFTGIYTKRVSYQNWSDKRKKIMREELVFPYPQNWQFLALRTEKAIDAK